MSNAKARMSDADLTDLMVKLASRPEPPDRTRASAEIVPMRRDLGLAPIGDDDPEPELEIDTDVGEPVEFKRNDNRPAWLTDIDSLVDHARRRERKFVFAVVGEILGETMAELGHDLRKEFGRTPETPDAQASLRVEIAELKAALAEARAETRELKTIQEGMRSSSRGERGEPGARGVPGRDGQTGPAGPQGPKGESDAKAAGFILNIPEYSASLVLSDGTPAAQLRLRPMLEQFASELASDDE